MGNVLLDMAISLDGSVGIPNDYTLHNWYFSGEGSNAEVVAELLATTGSIVMGRRAYDEGDKENGFVDNPYKVPHFVLTHAVPQKVAEGTTSFTFVTDGIESLLAQAKAAAGDKFAVIGGGADIARQALKAGLVDEIHLHVVSVLLGKGPRLFDTPEAEQIALERIGVIASEGVTHLRYRVAK